MLEGRQPLGFFIFCDRNRNSTLLEQRRDLLVYTNIETQKQGGLQEQLDPGAQMMTLFLSSFLSVYSLCKTPLRPSFLVARCFPFTLKSSRERELLFLTVDQGHWL